MKTIVSGDMESLKAESELPNRMASLDLLEIDKSDSNDKQETALSPDRTTRILRKRKSPTHEMSKSNNRRVSMKPRKHILSENLNRKQLEALYLNKKVNTISQTLETIYEEPKNHANNDTFIGGRKVKRLLTFQSGNQYTKDKIKKRRAKIKKMLSNQSFINRKKIPMHVFLKTIECLDLDEVVEPETSNKL